eukprot:6492763-Amphidinium_carterae.1
MPVEVYLLTRVQRLLHWSMSCPTRCQHAPASFQMSECTSCCLSHLFLSPDALKRPLPDHTVAGFICKQRLRQRLLHPKDTLHRTKP